MRTSRAFTLVEMLVVLVIAALILSLAAVVTQPDDNDVLRAEADRLSRMFEVAGAEARLTGQTLAWTAAGSRYQFWRLRSDAGWLPIAAGETLGAHALPPGMAISGVTVDNIATAASQQRLEFPPYGGVRPFVVSMALGAHRRAVVGSPVGAVSVVATEEANSAATAR